MGYPSPVSYTLPMHARGCPPGWLDPGRHAADLSHYRGHCGSRSYPSLTLSPGNYQLGIGSAYIMSMVRPIILLRLLGNKPRHAGYFFPSSFSLLPLTRKLDWKLCHPDYSITTSSNIHLFSFLNVRLTLRPNGSLSAFNVLGISIYPCPSFFGELPGLGCHSDHGHEPDGEGGWAFASLYTGFCWQRRLHIFRRIQLSPYGWEKHNA